MSDQKFLASALQNAEDFERVMREESPHIGRFVANKLNAGMDPRDVATLLRYIADKAEGWCTGRHGSRETAEE